MTSMGMVHDCACSGFRATCRSSGPSEPASSTSGLVGYPKRATSCPTTPAMSWRSCRTVSCSACTLCAATSLRTTRSSRVMSAGIDDVSVLVSGEDSSDACTLCKASSAKPTARRRRSICAAWGSMPHSRRACLDAATARARSSASRASSILPSRRRAACSCRVTSSLALLRPLSARARRSWASRTPISRSAASLSLHSTSALRACSFATRSSRWTRRVRCSLAAASEASSLVTVRVTASASDMSWSNASNPTPTRTCCSICFPEAARSIVATVCCWRTNVGTEPPPARCSPQCCDSALRRPPLPAVMARPSKRNLQQSRNTRTDAVCSLAVAASLKRTSTQAQSSVWEPERCRRGAKFVVEEKDPMPRAATTPSSSVDLPEPFAPCTTVTPRGASESRTGLELATDLKPAISTDSMV
eukprot:PhM_4_TR13008/c0_g1_i1/m.67988